MKTLFIFTLVLTLCACGEQAPIVGTTAKPETIVVLIENGGTIPVEEQDDARNTVFHLLQGLSKLKNRRATRDAKIHIIMSATPNRISWSGSPEQLLFQAEHIKSLMTFKQSFSDLVMAFEQIETTLKINMPERVRLYWIGSTIHVPYQAVGSGEIDVEVPQEVPSDLALPRLLNLLTTLKIYGVHNDQDQVLQAYLASHGVMQLAASGKLDFTLMGAAQTKSNLSNLL